MSNYKAIIKSVSAEIRTKSNGGETQLCQAEIMEGPLKGLTVLSQRTIKNAKGEVKPIVNVGDAVQLFHTQQESTTEPGTMQNFFEVSTGVVATQDEINARLLQIMIGANVGALAEQAV